MPPNSPTMHYPAAMLYIRVSNIDEGLGFVRLLSLRSSNGSPFSIEVEMNTVGDYSIVLHPSYEVVYTANTPSAAASSTTRCRGNGV